MCANLFTTYLKIDNAIVKKSHLFNMLCRIGDIWPLGGRKNITVLASLSGSKF